MLPSIDKLLTEFERLTLDERVYFTFVSEEELDVCVQFKNQTEKPWSIWYGLSQDASKQTCSRSHVPFVLKAFKVNERHFIREVVGVLLTQAAYADEFVRQVTALVGEEAVRNSIRETQHFMEHMSQVVSKLLQAEPAKPEASAVKPNPEGDKDPSGTRSRLRVIRT